MEIEKRVTKASIIRKLSSGESIKVIAPNTHKYFGVIRKPDKIQTNAVRLDGGGWLYFNDIDSGTGTGFKLKPISSNIPQVEYEWVVIRGD